MSTHDGHEPLNGAGAVTPLAVVTADGLPVIERGPIDNLTYFERFSCDVRSASPPTPDRVEPDASYTFGVHSTAKVNMPDGVEVPFMSFHHWIPDGENDDHTKIFPGPMIRVREGQVVHTTLIPSRDTHTIHHHGIEPTAHNDGVGHASFEVHDQYTYQWRPSSAGTYFYHCHKNTTLHFEMGMYGPLIVDPPQGEGFVRLGTDVVPYDHEAIWIPDDVDSRWHAIEDHHTGLRVCPLDPSTELLYFDPDYWLFSGVPHPRTRTDPSVQVQCRVGERVIVRLLNAAYGPVHVDLPFDALVVGIDGKTLGDYKTHRYSRPYTIPAYQHLEMSTAQRYDLLLEPDQPGTWTVPFVFHHWTKDTAYGLAETTFTVME